MKTFKQFIAEDGGAGGVASSGPTVTTGPSVAGMGGPSGEPGVHMRKKRKVVMTKFPLKRLPPKM